MKWQVCGTMQFAFDVDVEADNEEDAEQKVRDMDVLKLIDGADMEEVDVDSITELDATGKAVR
jgi:hypothetical protein